MLLSRILDELYFPLNLRVRTKDTRKQYHLSVENLAEQIGHPPTIDDLSDDNVIRMMSGLLDRGLAHATVNDRRIRINALWTWLAKKGYLKNFPCNSPVDEPEPDPTAWTREEMRRLVEAANSFGLKSRKDLRKWWCALFYVVWDSGGRTGELLALRWEWLDWSTGRLRVPAAVRKGRKKSAIYQLKFETLEALKALEPKETGSIFLAGTTVAAYYARYRSLLKRANIPVTRKNGLQKWRRSHATYLEAAGGDATRQLLHDSRATTTKSYLDRGILHQEQNHLLFPLGSVD